MEYLGFIAVTDLSFQEAVMPNNIFFYAALILLLKNNVSYSLNGDFHTLHMLDFLIGL